MTKTKRMYKCRVIECNTYTKLEILFDLIWPAGQARSGGRLLFDFLPGLQAPRFRSGQARLEKSGLLAALIGAHWWAPSTRKG